MTAEKRCTPLREFWKRSLFRESDHFPQEKGIKSREIDVCMGAFDAIRMLVE